MTRARLRPLRARPGARFACGGDGLCCTDVHLLGPVTRAEKKRLTTLSLGAHVRRAEEGALALTVTEGGECAFLRERACALHAAHGAESKPRSCRRFPFLVVATPDGGRLGTDHRCPCRSMGERAPLAPETAMDAIVDDAGRISADRRVEGDVALTPSQRVPWARWAALEARLVERLAGGEDPSRVLAVEPFGALVDTGWDVFAHLLREEDGEPRWARAQAWAGDAIAEGTSGLVSSPRARPWSAAFDRAEARTSRIEDPARMLGDWLADGVWSLEWLERGSFAHARSDLVSRARMAHIVSESLAKAGARRDRAMAEAIAVVELAGLSDVWDLLVPRFEVGALSDIESVTWM